MCGNAVLLHTAYSRPQFRAPLAGCLLFCRRLPYALQYWTVATPIHMIYNDSQDGPTMPIVAEGDEEPNDTFREQLIASAEAAVKVGIWRSI